MHRVVQTHKRLVPNMSRQLDARPWLDLSTTTPSIHLHPFHAKSFRCNPYSSEKEGTSGHVFLKDLHQSSQSRGVASNEVALVLLTTFTTLAVLSGKPRRAYSESYYKVSVLGCSAVLVGVFAPYFYYRVKLGKRPFYKTMK